MKDFSKRITSLENKLNELIPPPETIRRNEIIQSAYENYKLKANSKKYEHQDGVAWFFLDCSFGIIDEEFISVELKNIIDEKRPEFERDLIGAQNVKQTQK